MEYNSTTAYHYGSFRPGVHSLILEAVLETGIKYESGLDVGCGTGISTEALARYCRSVTGVDPSRQMLARALPSEQVNFKWFDGISIPFPDDSFDIVTFAGSLFYADKHQILRETQRVTKVRSLIIVYDFNVDLEVVLKKLDLAETGKSDYDHTIAFDGINEARISLHSTIHDIMNFSFGPPELAHMLLSDDDLSIKLYNGSKSKDVYDYLCLRLEETFNGKDVVLPIYTYATLYKTQ